MTQILQWIGWFLLQIYEFFESAHIPAAYAPVAGGGSPSW